MKSTLCFTASLLLFSISASAATLALQGKGIDGKACSVRLDLEAGVFTKLDVTGSTRIFEIISETEKGYLPASRIATYGGSDLTEMMQDMVNYFKPQKGLLARANTYVLDTNDIPQNGDQPKLKMLKIRAVMTLGFDKTTQQLKSVRIAHKMKASLITVASSDFVCTQ